MKSSRAEELEKIRQKTVQAIRFSERYWMIFKEGTFGLATILNLIYKKSYIEVLFFTNTDVLKRGVPLLKVYSPLDTVVDFDTIVVDPDFDEDGLLSPAKIIERINELIDEEFQHHLETLDNEIDLIKQEYENYQIDEIPYYREIRIYFPDFLIEFTINFEKYPLVPDFEFSKDLSRIITEEEFMQRPILSKWDQDSPPHIIDIVNEIKNAVKNRLNEPALYKNSQHILFENVSISNEVRNVSFKALRGESIGIHTESVSKKSEKMRADLLRLFNVVKGYEDDFSGKIKIFGKYLQLLSKEEQGRILLLPEAFESNVYKMPVKKAIKHGIEVNPTWEFEKKEFDKKLKDAGLLPIAEEYATISPTGRIINWFKKWINKKRFINDILSESRLFSKKKIKFSDLTALDYLIFSISRALIQSPNLIMFSIPPGLLDRLEFDKFNEFIDRIKRKYHVVILINGPKEMVSKCDKIVTIKKERVDSGTYDELIKKLPQSGDIISIEMQKPSKKIMNEMFNIEDVVFIEERKNEKYKLFLHRDPDEVILQLIEILGPSLFHLKVFKASLGEYLEFLENLDKIS
jgi:predicted ABC-type transport system involved in lysophospholipase L1 biosynthesis ATPase subunit